jgi:hypothetical protein
MKSAGGVLHEGAKEIEEDVGDHTGSFSRWERAE